MTSRFAEADAMGSAAMDEWFGEPVHLIPWKESSFTSGADPDRAEADFVAIVGGAMSTQNLGGGNTGGGSNFAGTATTKDWTATVDHRHLPAQARVGDHIRVDGLPDAPVFRIDSIVSDGLNRFFLQMTVVNP